jgi:cell division protein FtsW (lipid II flippase)
LLPTTGTTMPFISNGSNALIVNFTLIGIILGVERKNKTIRKTQKF